VVQHHEADTELKHKKLGGLISTLPAIVLGLVGVSKLNDFAQCVRRVPKLFLQLVGTSSLDHRDGEQASAISVSPWPGTLKGDSVELEALTTLRRPFIGGVY
jgi:hypothetical protein